MSNKFKLAMKPIFKKMYESPREEYYMNTFPLLVSLELLEDDNFDNDDKKIEKFFFAVKYGMKPDRKVRWAVEQFIDNTQEYLDKRKKLH